MLAFGFKMSNFLLLLPYNFNMDSIGQPFELWNKIGVMGLHSQKRGSGTVLCEHYLPNHLTKPINH